MTYPDTSPRQCRLDDCERKMHALGLCRIHYRRQKATGSTELRTDMDRFLASYVVADDGCWNWTRGMHSDGYGLFFFDGRHSYAHRFAVLHITRIAIPAGMHVDHLCRNRACCNPDHLEVVTPRTNILRGDLALRHAEWRARQAMPTHCAQGHEFTPENTRTDGGTRRCRACDSAYQKRKHDEQRSGRQAS